MMLPFLEAVDTHETVDEIVTVNGDEIKNFIAVGIDEAEATVVQDNGSEVNYGTIMEDIFMDDGAVTVEGTEARQDEIAIEESSMGNGTTDADGAQAH